ncbi:hypothetical protein L9F63_011694, partial [Diploptera punctata]
DRYIDANIYDELFEKWYNKRRKWRKLASVNNIVQKHVVLNSQPSSRAFHFKFFKHVLLKEAKGARSVMVRLQPIVEVWLIKIKKSEFQNLPLKEPIPLKLKFEFTTYYFIMIVYFDRDTEFLVCSVSAFRTDQGEKVTYLFHLRETLGSQQTCEQKSQLSPTRNGVLGTRSMIKTSSHLLCGPFSINVLIEIRCQSSYHDLLTPGKIDVSRLYIILQVTSLYFRSHLHNLIIFQKIFGTLINLPIKYGYNITLETNAHWLLKELDKCFDIIRKPNLRI